MLVDMNWVEFQTFFPPERCSGHLLMGRDKDSGLQRHRTKKVSLGNEIKAEDGTMIEKTLTSMQSIYSQHSDGAEHISALTHPGTSPLQGSSQTYSCCRASLCPKALLKNSESWHRAQDRPGGLRRYNPGNIL
jgi:hypothetical protein